MKRNRSASILDSAFTSPPTITTSMPTITLKNVPEALHRRLKARAEQNRRSLNREAIRCLEEAVADERPDPSGFDPQAFLADVRRTREAMVERGVWVTEEALREAIDEGRP